MRTGFIFLIFCLCGWSCSRNQNRPDPQSVIETSFIQVLANPDSYDGKNVSLIGYYPSNNPDSSIFFTKEHAMLNDRKNGVFFSGREDGKAFLTPYDNFHDNKYIAVSGIFRKGPAGSMGLWPGALIPVFHISYFDEDEKKWIPLEIKE